MTGSIIVKLKCPKCKKSVMSHHVQMDGEDTILLEARSGKQQGGIYLSSVYGNYNKKFDSIPDNDGQIYEFYCPHCHQPLSTTEWCECHAPMVSLVLHQGGKIKICSRNGCKHHSLEFEDINDAFQLMVNGDKTGLG